MGNSRLTKTILSGAILIGIATTGFAAPDQAPSPAKQSVFETIGESEMASKPIGYVCVSGALGCFDSMQVSKPLPGEQHCSFGFDEKPYGVGRSKEYSVEAKLFYGKKLERSVSGIIFSGKPGIESSATQSLSYIKNVLYTEDHGKPLTLPEPASVTTGNELAIMLDKNNPDLVKYCVSETDLVEIKKLKHGIEYPVVKGYDSHGKTTLVNGEKTVALGDKFSLKIKVTPFTDK